MKKLCTTIFLCTFLFICFTAKAQSYCNIARFDGTPYFDTSQIRVQFDLVYDAANQLTLDLFGINKETSSIHVSAINSGSQVNIDLINKFKVQFSANIPIEASEIISIYNLQGKAVFSQNILFKKGQSSMQITFDKPLQPGMYFVKIKGGDSESIMID